MYDLDEILNWDLNTYFGECSYEGGDVNDLKIVIKRILVVIRVCDVLEASLDTFIVRERASSVTNCCFISSVALTRLTSSSCMSLMKSLIGI